MRKLLATIAACVLAALSLIAVALADEVEEVGR
jgi:hypothetical protein